MSVYEDFQNSPIFTDWFKNQILDKGIPPVSDIQIERYLECKLKIKTKLLCDNAVEVVITLWKEDNKVADWVEVLSQVGSEFTMTPISILQKITLSSA